jgi:hypothetical protein
MFAGDIPALRPGIPHLLLGLLTSAAHHAMDSMNSQLI